MSARTVSKAHLSLVPLIASMGWTLVLPWQWFIVGTNTEIVISWIWVACLTLPFGYWAAYGTRPPRNRAIAWPRTLIWLAVVAIIYGGLALTPDGFGLSGTPIREWLAALAGVLLGAGLAARIAKSVASRQHDDQIKAT